MARFNIPDPDEADDIMELVVNATDRARIGGLEFAAELAEDMAESRQDRVALLAFKYGDEKSGGAGADLATAARIAAEIHRRQAGALKAEAEATRASLDKEVEPKKPAKPRKEAERVEVEITVRQAGAAAKGTRVALVAGGRDIAEAEADDKGVARFALDPEALTPPARRGLHVAPFRAVGQPDAPAGPVLLAEIRSETRKVLRRTTLQPDFSRGKKPKFRIDLEEADPGKGKTPRT